MNLSVDTVQKTLNVNDVQRLINGSRKQMLHMYKWALEHGKEEEAYSWSHGYFRGLAQAYSSSLKALRWNLRRLGLHA